MEDIFRKPPPSPAETFYNLTYDIKSEDEMRIILMELTKADDRDTINVIFKKSKFREIRILAGKILYYPTF
jgi:hypothetical protein